MKSRIRKGSEQMDWKKRAGAYLIRKKIRTGILFFIMVLISSAVLAVLSMQESTGKVEEKLLSLSNSGFQVESILNDGGIQKKQLTQIEKTDGVKDVQYEYDAVGQLQDAKAVQREQSVQLDQGNLGELVGVRGVSDSNNEMNFASGALNIQSGRALTKEDRNKVLIHEELAKENNWTVGSKIKMKLFKNGEEGGGSYDEITVEVVGIFNGKLSEQSTGLTSDLTENRMYMDYKTSQLLAGNKESNEVVHRAIYTVKNPSQLDSVIKEVKKLSLNWETLQLSKNEQVFEQVSGPISNFKSLMMLLTGSVFALAVIILFLILLFTLRERIHEFGILLSLGISRGKIISQILLELFTIASGSYLIALFFGEFVANQFYSGLISSDDIPAQVKSLFESSLPQLTLMEGVKTLVIVIVIIVLAVLFSTAVILMKKPKKILSQMN
ncbi:efflux ABC transporter, permease protein [Granulicatella adiacens ATCC 49175]|uniref:Efflux ABC transporter, permease protein n=2 Tax=Granulicatella adiacens TaxID=46124 RepID=C8NDN8_9LACT|nr:efflux ABC transporter, permease protein [Granulicatella adiacens ATCC 49175]